MNAQYKIHEFDLIDGWRWVASTPDGELAHDACRHAAKNGGLVQLDTPDGRTHTYGPGSVR